VNTADRGAWAERTARELEAGLRLGEREAKSWQPPVLLVSARDGTGIDPLLDALEAHRVHAAESGALRVQRDAGAERFVIDALVRRYGTFGLAALGGAEGVRARFRAMSQTGSFGAVDRLGGEIETALAAPRPS
jgi:LAO/AO transport system kinase